MKTLLGALCLFVLTLTGCSALSSAIPVIQSAVTDSSLVLNGIESVFDAYQVTHPVSPTDRAEYDQLLAAANQALLLGGRTVSDLKQVDQGQYDAAFADFAAAYQTLTAFLKTRGISPIGAGLVGVGTAGADAFPVPRVIGLRIQS
jgi:hypothetical protein